MYVCVSVYRCTYECMFVCVHMSMCMCMQMYVKVFIRICRKMDVYVWMCQIFVYVCEENNTNQAPLILILILIRIPISPFLDTYNIFSFSFPILIHMILEAVWAHTHTRTA